MCNCRLEKIEERLGKVEEEIIQEIAEFEVGEEVWHEGLQGFHTITKRKFSDWSGNITYAFQHPQKFYLEKDMSRRPPQKFKVGQVVYCPNHLDIEGKITKIKWSQAPSTWCYTVNHVSCWECSLKLKPRRTPKVGEVWKEDDCTFLVTSDGYVVLSGGLYKRYTDPNWVGSRATYLGTFSEVFHTIKEIKEAYPAALDKPLYKEFMSNLKKERKIVKMEKLDRRSALESKEIIQNTRMQQWITLYKVTAEHTKFSSGDSLRDLTTKAFKEAEEVTKC